MSLEHISSDKIYQKGGITLKRLARDLEGLYAEKRTIQHRDSHEGILERIRIHKIHLNHFLSAQPLSFSDNPEFRVDTPETPLVQAIAQDMAEHIRKMYDVFEEDVRQSAARSEKEGKFKKAWRLLGDEFTLEEKKSNIIERYMAHVINKCDERVARIASESMKIAYRNKDNPDQEVVINEIEKMLQIPKPGAFDYYAEKGFDVNGKDRFKEDDLNLFSLHKMPMPTSFPRFEAIANTVRAEQKKKNELEDRTPLSSAPFSGFKLFDLIDRKKENMDFGSLFDRYSALAKSLGASVTDEQIAGYASILSNAGARDMFGLEAKFYNPANLDAIIEKKLTQADKMERFAMMKFLKGAIEQGRHLLGEYQQKIQDNNLDADGPRFNYGAR